jgi:hypothetical protein
VRQVDADGEAKEAVDLAHPLGVAIGEVVVDRDDVDALAGERVEIGGKRRDQRLALAGLHLGDLAVVQHHAADQLHVEVAHAQRAFRGLAYHRESLGQQLIQGGAVRVPLLQLLGLAAQLRIGKLRELRLERIDLRYDGRVLLQQALIATAEYPRRKVLEKLENLAQDLEDFGAHVTGSGKAMRLPDPQKPLILSGKADYLARATVDSGFDTRNLVGFWAAPR